MAKAMFNSPPNSYVDAALLSNQSDISRAQKKKNLKTYEFLTLKEIKFNSFRNFHTETYQKQKFFIGNRKSNFFFSSLYSPQDQLHLLCLQQSTAATRKIYQFCYDKNSWNNPNPPSPTNQPNKQTKHTSSSFPLIVIEFNWHIGSCDQTTTLWFCTHLSLIVARFVLGVLARLF